MFEDRVISREKRKKDLKIQATKQRILLFTIALFLRFIDFLRLKPAKLSSNS